jgi:predicted transcriptional regulator
LRLEELYALIEELPKGLKEASLLYYKESLSTTEVAQHLGISSGAVSKRLSDARAKLKLKVAQRQVEARLAASLPLLLRAKSSLLVNSTAQSTQTSSLTNSTASVTKSSASLAKTSLLSTAPAKVALATGALLIGSASFVVAASLFSSKPKVETQRPVPAQAASTLSSQETSNVSSQEASTQATGSKASKQAPKQKQEAKPKGKSKQTKQKAANKPKAKKLVAPKEQKPAKPKPVKTSQAKLTLAKTTLTLPLGVTQTKAWLVAQTGAKATDEKNKKLSIEAKGYEAIDFRTSGSYHLHLFAKGAKPKTVVVVIK